MNHGSLFSGIGGFDLAAEWMGWNNIFHCEWNPFGQKLLKHYWPKAISYEDITKTDFTVHRGQIDILTGGFPCQPYSQAGKRLGKEDDRHLWPEMCRAIREIQPRYIVGENVSGLVNWNGGMVFNEVQAEMEAEGYEVTPFILPAVSVNAPHRRDRVWFVAYNNIKRLEGCEKVGRERGKCKSEWNEIRYKNRAISSEWSTTDTDNAGGINGCGTDGNGEKIDKGREGQSQPEFRENGCNEVTPDTDSDVERLLPGQKPKQRSKTYTLNSNISGHGDATDTNGIGLRNESNRIGESGFFGQNSKGNYWKNFPTQSPVCNGNDGIFSRLDGITFSKWRNESIKAGGNAIVPQVAYQIFQAINKFESL